MLTKRLQKRPEVLPEGKKAGTLPAIFSPYSWRSASSATGEPMFNSQLWSLS